MIGGIIFNENLFYEKSGNKMIQLTDNNIILCDSDYTKGIIECIIGADEDGNESPFDMSYYTYDDKDVTLKSKEITKPLSVIEFTDTHDMIQRFYITTEVSCLYQAKRDRDIWFVSSNDDEKLFMIPLTDYIGCEKYAKDIMFLIRDILAGRIFI